MGCQSAGEYPAPRSRKRLWEYRWLCLEHVREYNRNWNFFDGMSRAQVEAQIHAHSMWDVPTSPTDARLRWSAARINDPIGVVDSEPSSQPPTQPPLSGAERQNLEVLGFSDYPGVEVLRRRHRELVKDHHPDLHAGDPHKEELLKRINHAFSALMETFG